MQLRAHLGSQEVKKASSVSPHVFKSITWVYRSVHGRYMAKSQYGLACIAYTRSGASQDDVLSQTVRL